MPKLLKIFSKNVLVRKGKMTQAELAKKSGVNQGSLSQLLSEQGNPSLETIEAIAEALSASPTELLGAYGKSYDVPQDILELLEENPGMHATIRSLLKSFSAEKSKTKKKAN